MTNMGIGFATLVAMVAAIWIWTSLFGSPSSNAANGLGDLCDKRGNCVSYKSKVMTKAEYGAGWPFEENEVILVCPDMELIRIFVLSGQPYAANGVTITFAKKWRTTLDVGGQKKPVVEFMGAVGNILFKIEEMC